MTKHLAFLALLLISQPSISQDEFLDIPKAVVQFDGRIKSGTYTQSGNTITVTPNTAFNFRVGDFVYLTGGHEGYREITSVSGNSFTVTSPTSATRSGNITVRTWVKVHFNIKSVTTEYLIQGTYADGLYNISFVTPFADERYAAIGGGRYWTMMNITPGTFQVEYHSHNGDDMDQDYATFVFYGKQ
jgi:hypothetical protein